MRRPLAGQVREEDQTSRARRRFPCRLSGQLVRVTSFFLGLFFYSRKETLKRPLKSYASVIYRPADYPTIFCERVAEESQIVIDPWLVYHDAHGPARPYRTGEDAGIDRPHSNIRQHTVIGPDDEWRIRVQTETFRVLSAQAFDDVRGRYGPGKLLAL